MKHAYYESKWKYEDLSEKTVEFALRTYSGVCHGNGKFRIHVHGDLIAVCIYKDIRAGVEDVHSLWNPALADKIERHPDKTVADYRLVE